MRLRLNSRNGHKPVRLKPEPKPSPMNWRPQSADDLIGQARSVCAAQVAKARRLRDTSNAASKLLLYGPPGVGKTSVAAATARAIARDGLRTVTEPVAGTCLDLDEHGHVAVAGDDVDFAIAGAVAAFENCVPALEQFCAGDVFANDSEQMSFVCRHDPRE